MPANTVNRSYPYPVPADPADIPGDLQRFAEAVDADVCELKRTIPLRPAFRISANNPVRTTNTPPTDLRESLTFDREIFNTGLPYTVTIAEALNVGIRCVVRPQLPGFYWVLGAISVPRATDGVPRNEMRIEILRDSDAILAAESNHLVTSASDAVRTCACATGVNLNGTTDGVQIGFVSSDLTPGTKRMTITERNLTVIRMSPTYP